MPWNKRLTAWWFAGSMLVVIGLLISSLRASEPLRGIIVSAQYGFVFWFLPLIVVNLAELGRVELRRVAHWFLLGMVAVELVGLVLYFSDTTIRNDLIVGGRMGSLLENPNTLGKMIGLALPILFYLRSIRRIGLLETVVQFVVAIAALAITGSFGGILTALFSLMAFVLITLLRRNGWTVFLQTTVAVLLVVLMLYAGLKSGYIAVPTIIEKRVVQPLLEGGSLGSLEDKLGLMEEALHYITSSPIIGLGADEYKRVSRFFTPVHNTYLLLWAEGGFLSFIGIITMLSAQVSFGWQLLRKGHTLDAAMTLAVVSALALACITNTHIYARFWLLPAILATSMITADGEQTT